MVELTREVVRGCVEMLGLRSEMSAYQELKEWSCVIVGVWNAGDCGDS